MDIHYLYSADQGKWCPPVYIRKGVECWLLAGPNIYSFIFYTFSYHYQRKNILGIPTFWERYSLNWSIANTWLLFSGWFPRNKYFRREIWSAKSSSTDLSIGKAKITTQTIFPKEILYKYTRVYYLRWSIAFWERPFDPQSGPEFHSDTISKHRQKTKQNYRKNPT